VGVGNVQDEHCVGWVFALLPELRRAKEDNDGRNVGWTENASTAGGPSIPDIDKHANTIAHAVRFLGTKPIAVVVVVVVVVIAGVLLAMVGKQHQ
jgi:hypothetical protein